MARKHLFGPVASRRLGRSLGVDLVPAKTCPFDCIYCEVGRTTRHTAVRQHFYPPEEILAQIEEFFAGGGQADFITITASGEPTLSLDIAEIISECKKRFKVPVAVITDGALLYDGQVRRDLAAADVVMPSLDAARAQVFERINRPAPPVTLEKVIEGLVAFAREYKGRMWLEVLLAEGVNDSDEDVEALAGVIARIRPDRVQLNTVVRPPADGSTRAVSAERLEEIARRLSGVSPVEIIAPAALRAGARTSRPAQEAILETVRRRPCTAEDLAAGLSLSPEQVEEALAALTRSGKVREVAFDRTRFYEAAD